MTVAAKLPATVAQGVGPPEPDLAFVVLYHPYAYVALCDVHYADERLAA